jgi:hypothetical protein
LQQAITRKEKAQETVKKKVRKAAERTAAREELTCEKAARRVEKEIKYKKRAKQSCAKLKLKRDI